MPDNKHTNREVTDNSVYTSSVQAGKASNPDQKTVFLWKPVTLAHFLEILKYEGGPTDPDQINLPALSIKWEVEDESAATEEPA